MFLVMAPTFSTSWYLQQAIRVATVSAPTHAPITCSMQHQKTFSKDAQMHSRRNTWAASCPIAADIHPAPCCRCGPFWSA